jgi:hypothetical protein
MLSNVCGDAIALLVYYLLNRFFPADEAQVEEAVHDVKPGVFERESSEEGEEGEDREDRDKVMPGPEASPSATAEKQLH